MSNAKAMKLQPAAAEPRARACERGRHGKRASSCPRCYHDNARVPVAVEARGRAASKARAAVPREVKPRTTATTAELKPRLKTRTAATTGELKAAAKSPTSAQPQPSSAQPRTQCETHSHKAFTVFAPNPKKRQDIQKKAEAELAALEDLRLSRAMSYVSISPSTVGGCLTLEEVRIKQQQEMLIKRRQKQVKKYALETSPMVFG